MKMKFFNTSCDPYMSHTLNFFSSTFYLQKDMKDSLHKKCLKYEKKKLDKSFRVINVLKFILLNDIVRNLALK